MAALTPPPQNWSSEKYNPVPGVMPARSASSPSHRVCQCVCLSRDARCSAASRGYTEGFAAELILKDLGLAKDAADSVKLTLPLGQVAHAKYTAMKSSGDCGRDFSAIFESVVKNK